MIAFSSQLILSVAQALAINHQTVEAERIHSQTQVVLTEIDSAADEMLQTQRGQFGLILNRVLSAIPVVSTPRRRVIWTL